MARTAEQSSRQVQVPKQGGGEPALTIHTLGHSALRTPARRISKVDESVRDLARDMLRAMYAANGIGLAAPQVGVHKQLLVIDLDPENAAAPPLVLVNPEIRSFGPAPAAQDRWPAGPLHPARDGPPQRRAVRGSRHR
jgi:peptide deformylase